MPKIVPNYRDEVRTKIIQTAWEVLLEKGALESTMDDFAKALNCSKGALYNYFRNKEELLEQTICSKKIEFEEQLFARFPKETSWKTQALISIVRFSHLPARSQP